MKPVYRLPSNITELVPLVNQAIAEYNKTGRKIVIYDDKNRRNPAFYHEVEKFHMTVPNYLTPLTAEALNYALLTAGIWEYVVAGDEYPRTLPGFSPRTLAAILEIVKIDPEAFPDVPRY